MGLAPSRQPPPESLPSAAISELTELLDRPLGALMTATEGPFMQEWSRAEGLSEPNPGLWPQDQNVAQHGDSSEGGNKTTRQAPPWPLIQAGRAPPPPSSPNTSNLLAGGGGGWAAFPLPLQLGIPWTREVCGQMNDFCIQFSKLR